jgi:hypothetical protein
MWHFPLIGLLVVGAWRKAKGNTAKGKMTASQEYLFNSILEHKDLTSDQIRQYAQAFEESELPYPASILRKRAALKEASPETKAQHRELIAEVYKCNDPAVIRAVAKEFEKIAAIGNARDLRHHADIVEQANRIAAETMAKTAPPIPDQTPPNAKTNGVEPASQGTIGPDIEKAVSVDSTPAPN